MDQGGQNARVAAMLTVCFHGAESTGKSVLARRLEMRFGYPWVPEYGREYCEAHGTDLTMADLLAIAEGHADAVTRAKAAQPSVLLVDTDHLMTAAWAQMLFGEMPAQLFSYPMADLYLLFEADVPWMEDGTRLFGATDERARFAALAEQVLLAAGVPFQRIAGDWGARETAVVRAIEDALRQRS